MRVTDGTKTETVRVRLTRAEYDRLRRWSEQVGLSMSEFLVDMAGLDSSVASVTYNNQEPEHAPDVELVA